ncbi:TIGR02587 family membrane protein [Tianweitania sediminis]|uniref:TIGR02587 family membrane protein n=1 Tax=Tianweitania sediminis TaxID=1502156 RepID=UPI003158C7EC|nr:TIGR02587 family membrane protein [Tianweitania sediminis]
MNDRKVLAGSGGTNRAFLIGLARAFAGAIIFALPLFMTMEMWSIASYIEPLRFLLFLGFGLVLMIVLAFFSGFETSDGWLDATLDGVIAFAVGMISSGMLLWLFGVFPEDVTVAGALEIIALQAVPAGMGAVLATKQLGDERDENESEQTNEGRAGYFGQLILMLGGALFVGFNVAPTEEMLLITVSITPSKALALMACSILILHAFVYTVGFAGQEERPDGAGFLLTFAHYSVVGYALALACSAYVLWTFGRMDDVSLSLAAAMSVVLAFPASIGAGIARLVV